jgi:hypothetical protein
VVYEFDIREGKRELNGEQHTTVSAYVTEVLGKAVGEFHSQSGSCGKGYFATEANLKCVPNTASPFAV